MDPRHKAEDDKLWGGWLVLYRFVLYRSRKQPAAALRGGGPDRPEARAGLVGFLARTAFAALADCEFRHRFYRHPSEGWNPMPPHG